MSLYSSWVAHHHCSLLGLLCSSLLLYLLDFLIIGKGSFLCFAAAVLEDQPALSVPFALQGILLQVILPRRFLNRPKSCLLKSGAIIPVFILLISPRILNYYLLIVAAKTVVNICIHNQFLIVILPAKHAPLSASWLCQEVVFNMLQKSHRFLVPCHFALPADPGVVQVPHGNQSL